MESLAAIQRSVAQRCLHRQSGVALSQQPPIKSSAGQSCQVEIAAVGVGPCFPNATASGLSLNSQLPSAVLSSVVFFFLFVGVVFFFERDHVRFLTYFYVFSFKYAIIEYSGS